MPPRFVTRQVLQQVHPHIFVLWTDKPKSQQERAERECRVIPDGSLSELRILLVDALRGDCHSQNNVGFYLARMECGIEQPPFYCAVVEHGMNIQGVMLSST